MQKFYNKCSTKLCLAQPLLSLRVKKLSRSSWMYGKAVNPSNKLFIIPPPPSSLSLPLRNAGFFSGSILKTMNYEIIPTEEIPTW